jgi:hypothetical protein
MAPQPVRLAYGPKKYAALHLLLCRWIRLHGTPEASYCYVTLGGTELRDIESLRFVDARLTSSVWSYEDEADRHGLAQKNAAKLIAAGTALELRHASIFSHKRSSELPHIFFVDILGIFAWGDYDRLFAAMFQNQVIREGDCLLITSHLGHRPGLDAVRKQFSGEFAVLGIDENNDKLVRGIFRRAHPTMTLYKALCLNGIQSELSLHCFGAVKYRDGTPMGIYGYTVSPGRTQLGTFVSDAGTTYFDMGAGRQCKPEDF